MKKSNWVQIAVLLIFICGLFAVNLLTGDRAFSPVENRNLAQRPHFSWEALLSGDFMRDFEEYVTDQFAGRDGWTALKAYAERALGRRENNGIYISGDTLIEKFDTLNNQLLDSNLQAVNQFTENVGIPVYLMLIPSAAQSWQDRLPAGAPNIDQAAVIEEAHGKISAQPVDALSALAAHADEQIFYRTDHHWTSLGACYGADALLKTMGRAGVSPDEWEKQTVSTDFYGTLFSSSGARYVLPDCIELYVPAENAILSSFEGGGWTDKPVYDMEKLKTKDQYSIFLGGNQPLAVIRTGNEGGKLLLIRDSYADCMAPFLMDAFSEIHLIDLRYYRMSVSEYIRESGIDEAAVAYSLKNFASDRNVFFLGLDSGK